MVKCLRKIAANVLQSIRVVLSTRHFICNKVGADRELLERGESVDVETTVVRYMRSALLMNQVVIFFRNGRIVHAYGLVEHLFVPLIIIVQGSECMAGRWLST